MINKVITKALLMDKADMQFQHISKVNRDKTPMRVRQSGMLKTWITRPDDFKLPVKHGLKTSFYITPLNAHEWRLVYYREITSY